ncbi:hypothetical protein THAPSDRAFT_263820, partial [Thalassiosira pseudonana CCMP1335]
GLYHGMAGETSTFTIHAYDFNRNRRVSGGDKWDVSVSSSVYDYNFGTVQDLLNGSYSVSITPHVSGINELTIALDGTPLGGGRYLINVTPLEAGAINLTIKMNGAHIRNSPFNITSHPGIFSGSFSSASGLGLYRAKAGEEATFIIQSKDGGGNNKVKDDASFPLEATVVDNKNGTYTVNYNPGVSGLYFLFVNINSSPV